MLSNSGINKVMLLGQVADEPIEDNQVKDQNFLCFRLVTTEMIKKGNENIPHKEYHRVKVPGKVISQDSFNLHPGQMIYIEGKIQTNSFIDSQRIKRYDLEIIAAKVEVHDFALAAV